MADLSGDRGLIPAYNPANQLKPCLRQQRIGEIIGNVISVTNLAFLKPSLVAVRKRRWKPGTLRWCLRRCAQRNPAGSRPTTGRCSPRPLDDLRVRIDRRQVIRPEDDGLDAVAQVGNGAATVCDCAFSEKS